MDLVVRQARLPEPGETIFGDSLVATPGGKGLNQAVAAALAGGDVSFLGAVGDDAHGRELRQRLDDHGIGTTALATVDSTTGTALIMVLESAENQGENAIVVVSGANDAVTELDAASELAVREATYLVAQLERPMALVSDAFQVARGEGVTTVLTPAPVSRIDPTIFDLVDILIPNAGEAAALTGLDDDVDAALALSKRVGTVIVTRGARGVLVARAGHIIADLPARAVQPIDTTGAGDTFVGVLVARLSLGIPLLEALNDAIIAASISVTRRGSSSSMPTWSEVEAVARQSVTSPPR